MEDQLPVAKKSHLFILTIALFLTICGATYFYLRTTYPFIFTDMNSRILALRESLTPSPTPQPTPASTYTPPAYVLPTGPQTYKFNHSDNIKGPKLLSFTIDPLDPEGGAKQTFTLKIDSTPSLSTGSLIISTDNRARTLNLSLIEGNSSSGTYSTSWDVNDTYDTTYAIRFILKSASDTYDNIMYLR